MAVVVSTHGGDEPAPIRAALDAGVGFVGVVCSHTRGAALLAELDLAEEERPGCTRTWASTSARARRPRSRSPILAEIVRRIRLEGLRAATSARAPHVRPLQAVDPVCGMTVTIGPDTIHAVVDGTDHWFCNPGCRDSFVADHVGHAS